jgi:hypothetical protein
MPGAEPQCGVLAFLGFDVYAHERLVQVSLMHDHPFSSLPRTKRTASTVDSCGFFAGGDRMLIPVQSLTGLTLVFLPIFDDSEPIFSTTSRASLVSGGIEPANSRDKCLSISQKKSEYCGGVNFWMSDALF